MIRKVNEKTNHARIIEPTKRLIVYFSSLTTFLIIEIKFTKNQMDSNGFK